MMTFDGVIVNRSQVQICPRFLLKSNSAKMGGLDKSGPRLRLHEGKCETGLVLIFSFFVGITSATKAGTFNKQNLGDPLAGIDFRRKRGGIADLYGDSSAPLRFKRGDIHNNPATGVGAFSHTDANDIAGNFKVFDRFRQGETIRWNDTEVRLNIHKRLGIKVFGINNRSVHIGKNFEAPAHPRVGALADGSTTIEDPTSPILKTAAGQNATFAFNTPGAYGFYCDFHYVAGMKGAVYVIP